MRFTSADYGWLLRQRAEGVEMLGYLTHVLPAADDHVVRCAGLLGALDRELDRRHEIASVVVECVKASEEAA